MVSFMLQKNIGRSEVSGDFTIIKYFRAD